jgi:hypothetical protein
MKREFVCSQGQAVGLARPSVVCMLAATTLLESIELANQ